MPSQRLLDSSAPLRPDSKHDPRKPACVPRDILFTAVIAAVATYFVLNLLSLILAELSAGTFTDTASVLRRTSTHRPPPLIFYNNPPVIGAHAVHAAIETAILREGKQSASCFEHPPWNELGMRAMLNRGPVHYYGCAASMPADRWRHVSRMRGGNVTFVTMFAWSEEPVLRAYLQLNKERKVEDIEGEAEIESEMDRYKEFVKGYNIAGLYEYYGGDKELTQCPVQFVHVASMRRVAERFEVVVDLARKDESAAMMEVATGVRVDFTEVNVREGEMLNRLRQVDTSEVDCGDKLVVEIMRVQFNVMKDRLMQNRCFDEGTAGVEVCERAVLTKEGVMERSRGGSFKERNRLRESRR